MAQALNSHARLPFQVAFASRSEAPTSDYLSARTTGGLAADMIEALPEALVIVDQQLRIVSANRRWIELQPDASSPVGDLLLDRFDSECAEHDLIALHQGLTELASEERAEFFHEYQRVISPIQLIECRAGRVPGRNDDRIWVHLWRKPATQSSAAHDRNMQIAILSAEEQERRRIARELHDDMLQQFTIMKFGVEALRSGAQSELVTSACNALEDALSRVQHQVRTLSYVLHPPELKERGLAAALGSFVKGFGRRSGIRASYHADMHCQTHAPGVELALYRVAQEALCNVMKHARASMVDVRLTCDFQNLILEIVDDGIGIPETFALERDQGALGVGLNSMTARVHGLSGTLTMHRGNPGTRVRAQVPCFYHLDVE